MTAADALLAAQTLEALENGMPKKTGEAVKARLLAKEELTEDGALKPFVELTLRCIRDIARRTGDSAEKHQAIMDLLTLGGF